MKNLFNKATQSISEVISGPKTKDIDFDLKVEEMKTTEKNILNLRSFLPKLSSFSSSSAKLFKEFSEAIRAVYGKNSICSNIGNEIADCNLHIERLFDDFANYNNEIYKSTNQWSTLFDNAKASIKEREESRKKFDKYLDKITKLEKTKAEKLKKNSFETKDSEKLVKTEAKFKKASDEYLNSSYQSYEKINFSIENRFEIINPIIARTIEAELKLFLNTFNSLRNHESIDLKLKNCMKSFYRPISNYDPSKSLKDIEYFNKNDFENHSLKSEDPMTKPQEKPVEKKSIFSNIGGFFKKEEAVKPNITSQIAEPVTNISKEYRNVPIVSNESNINRNYDHSTNNQNVVQNQPSLLNNILNIGPGTDRNKDIKIKHNNEEINVSQTINTLSAGMVFYNEHKESINQLTKIANNLKPSNESKSTMGFVLEAAGNILGNNSVKK